jgi:hypothetical protein
MAIFRSSKHVLRTGPRFGSPEQRHQFLILPHVIRNSRFHCRGTTERLVNSAEVVVHVMQAML